MSTPQERFLEYQAGRISIVHTMLELLADLEPFLLGDSPCTAETTDEQLFATVLGWHLRAIQVSNVSEALKMAVFTEVERRRIADDPSIDPNVAEKSAKRRNRGGKMKPGQVVLRAEIEEDTVYRLWRRIRRVHHNLTKDRGEAQDIMAMRNARVMDDEQLVDLLLWFSLTSPEGDGLLPELGAEPIEATERLREAAYQARVAEAIANGDIDGGEEKMTGARIGRLHPGDRSTLKHLREIEQGYIPPLNTEVEMYRRRHNLAFDDSFWTDDRIDSAIRLGMG